MWALKAGIVVAKRLPRPIRGWLAAGAGTLVYFADARGRNTALENLRCAFPEKSLIECKTLARASYRHLARTFLDLFWGQNLTPDNWSQHCELVLRDPDANEEAVQSGAIWTTTHYGNFEWTALVIGLTGLHFQIIAQAFRNPAITPIFQELREHTGHTVVPRERVMLRLYKTLRRRGHIAMLTDLNVDLAQSPAVIDCFGLKTCVTTLHAQLAVRCGVPVVPSLAIRRDDGHIDFVVCAPLHFSEATPPWQIAQQCWDAVEPSIRENPAQWMWMYKHWRYRPADAEEDSYPEYANPKRKFDRIIDSQQPA